MHFLVRHFQVGGKLSRSFYLFESKIVGLFKVQVVHYIFFLIVFFLLYPFYQFVRARKEAAVLEKTFGDEYRRYRASTWL